VFKYKIYIYIEQEPDEYECVEYSDKNCPDVIGSFDTINDAAKYLNNILKGAKHVKPE